MNGNIRSKAILRTAGIAVFAAMFCVGCGDKNTGGGDTDTTYFTITFDPTGGKVTPTSGTVAATGYPQTHGHISLPTPTRDGYTFKGWYTAEGDHGQMVAEPGLRAQFFGDATVYAHWTLDHYRITFDAHGGDVAPAYDTTGDDWRLASLPTPTRVNHEFVGWYKDVVGEREHVYDTTTYKENTILYAHWIYTGVHYKITFDANGGTVDPASEETDAGILEELPIPEWEGYAFIGWFTEKSGGTEVTTSTVFTEAATIYAQWILKTDKMYTVTFSPHDGTVYPAFGMTGEDGKLLAPLPTPKRDGYAFQGWFSEDGEVTGSTVFQANTTIHARWTIIHYTITLDATGGTVTPTSVATGSHWELSSLPTPTRSGYKFRGWFTAETGGTQVVPNSTPLMDNLTIYAHWSENNGHYTITFDANGGEVNPASAETGDGYRLASLPVPTRDGYAFHGWFFDKTGDAHVTTFTTFDSDATVYAQWAAVVYGEPVTYGGETYQTEVIGNQTWFARNLNYDVEGSKCYGQDGIVWVEARTATHANGHYETLSEAEVQANCEKYGRLYDWNAAISACPTGWHLPSDAEWVTLTDFVGGSAIAGWELKSPSSYWDYYLDDNFVVGADDFGFSALPGGEGFIYHGSELRYRYGEGRAGIWWSGTEHRTEYGVGAWSYRIWYHHEYAERAPEDLSNLHSVRCVKD